MSDSDSDIQIIVRRHETDCTIGATAVAKFKVNGKEYEVTLWTTGMGIFDGKITDEDRREFERFLKITHGDMNPEKYKKHIARVIKWLTQPVKGVWDEFRRYYAEEALKHGTEDMCPLFTGRNCVRCMARAVQRLLEKYGITHIETHVPPTPSGYGEELYVYDYLGNGKWRYEHYSDGEKDTEKVGTLEEIFGSWWMPYPELSRFVDMVRRKVEG